MCGSFVPQEAPVDALLTDTCSGAGGASASGCTVAPSASSRRAGAAMASACTDAATRSSASSGQAAPTAPLAALTPPFILNRMCVQQASYSSTGLDRESYRDLEMR